MPPAVDVYLLCYNEAVLLPHAVRHYRQWLPGCRITVLDNESTDGSPRIAEDAGCAVRSWRQRPGKLMDDQTNARLKNTEWKGSDADWVVVADMDEWLCVRPGDLERERGLGTTVLGTYAVNAVGFSQREDLADCDPLACTHGHTWKYGHKRLCFHRPSILDMRYTLGAHGASPRGDVRYGEARYLIKHMQFLGLPFYTRKMLSRAARNKGNVATHYTTSPSAIEARYRRKVERMKPFGELVGTHDPPPPLPPPSHPPPEEA